ncbi:MAG: transposase, partial [Chloroflexota bacterium]|nr:transposase [Chloroflexota bacterium]
NGLESFWAMFKRAHKGTYHKLSEKHLQRYVDEFAGRHNQREDDTADQMTAMARGFDKKRLRYEDLIAA